MSDVPTEATTPTDLNSAPANDVSASLSHIYQEYFGLKESPFSITPDPRYLYMSARHRDALAHLLFSVKQGGGFVQLTGEVGTGKTTLTRALLSQLPINVTAAIILNPKQSANEFVQSICDELHVPNTAGVTSNKALIDALNAYLLDAHTHNRRTLVLIDEAQNLAVDVLEQIRLLTNLETAKDKLLQIVLIGQPELRVLLDKQELRQLAQRVTARYHLLPLSQIETAEMVKYRLAVAGLTQSVFTDDALRLIHRSSKGVPRLINVICDRALLGAYTENRRFVDRRIMLRAAGEVMGYEQAQVPRIQPWWWALGVLGILLVISTTALIYKNNSPALAPKPASLTTVLPSSEVPAAPIDAVAIETPLVAIPIPVVTPVPPVPLTFIESLDDPIIHADLDSAMETLFKLWSKDYRTTSGTIPCERAEKVGLRCHTGSGKFTRLQRLNLPVILKLINAAGAERYAVITAINAADFDISLQGHIFKVPLAELTSSWRGDYALLWQRPAVINTLPIIPGTSGVAVKWLNDALNRIEGSTFAEANAFFYNDTVTARVKAFQKDRGLVPDGIVGELTLILMTVASKDATGPRLFTKKP